MPNLKRQTKSALFLITCTLGLGFAITSTPTAQASNRIHHTSPKAFRGTWYNYSSGTGWTIFKLTAHTADYRNTGKDTHAHEYIPSSKFVAALDNRKNQQWVFYAKGDHGAFTPYRRGKLKINGKYHPILVAEGMTVMTHFKTKHQYKVPKKLRSIQSDLGKD
ncbi:hypothetical protein [Secundilactobacillus muriivasis]